MAVDTPGWLKQAIIYEIFVRNHSAEGTFDRVTVDLERIRDLGVDIVWLMPIHPISRKHRKGTYGSPYAIRNYRAISSDLGDEVTLERLVDATHDLGMKIIIDVVYNHTGCDSVLTKEHPEWYLHDAEWQPIRKCDDWSDVYDLKYSDKALWDYQIDTLEHWVKLGIDGFRCDVASLVPLEFWLEARQRLNQKTDVIWLAESVHPSFVKYMRGQGYSAHADSELHQAFDLTYDYDGHEILDRYWQGAEPLSTYIKYLYVQDTLYPAHAAKMRFVENHDQPRIANLIKDVEKLQNWTAFYLLLPGASLVYAGQEIRATHLPNIFEKDPIDWQHGDQDFLAFFKRLVSLAKAIKHTCANFSIQKLATGIMQIGWSNATERYLAILNLEGKYGSLALTETICGTELLTEQRVSLTGQFRISAQPLIVKASD